MSPSDTKCEKPTLRAAAQSSTAVTMAPDWVTKAMSPARGAICAKLAFSPVPGAMMPRQFGPTMRSRCGFAASSAACRSVPPLPLPLWSGAPRPAVMMMAAFVPRAPSSAIRAGTLSGGVQITARSGVSGRLATSG